jgi:hypothetical protein
MQPGLSKLPLGCLIFHVFQFSSSSTPMLPLNGLRPPATRGNQTPCRSRRPGVPSAIILQAWSWRYGVSLQSSLADAVRPFKKSGFMVLFQQVRHQATASRSTSGCLSAMAMSLRAAPDGSRYRVSPVFMDGPLFPRGLCESPSRAGRVILQRRAPPGFDLHVSQKHWRKNELGYRSSPLPFRVRR